MVNYSATLYNDTIVRRMHVSAMIAFVRKNAVFVGLLLILLGISVGFGVYMMIQHVSDDVMASPGTVETPREGPSITSFEGNYGHDATVYLNWSIDRDDREIKSVKLYQNDRMIGGEMKDLTSFAMAQSIYQFPAGECQFVLQAEFEDGSEVKKEVTVFINYVLNINMETEPTDDGLLLKLSYSYHESTPVSVPRVKFINGNNTPFTVFYQETNTQKSGSIIHAETIFKLNTDQLAPGQYPLTIRWIFEGLNTSKDYEITVEK